MTREMHGLAFKVHSPSHYELLSVRDDIGDAGQVSVTFALGKWWINYRSPQTNVSRPFRTRDEAISLIADRRA